MTWSIVAVDRATGEVGAAAASCTVGVELILGLVPGKGVIVAQAATNLRARNRGVRMISAGCSPEEVIAEIANEAFDRRDLVNRSWTKQQYGVAVLDPSAPAANYTGTETVGWSGARASAHVSVQGNMLRDANVVDATFEAFRAGDGHLAENLLNALEAGAREGGDSRCAEDRAALTAFLAVSRPDDHPKRPSLLLVAPRAFGRRGSVRHRLFPYTPSDSTAPAVQELRRMFGAKSTDLPTS